MATDFYLLDETLTDEERAIRDRLRAFCDREVTPIINGYWERAEFPFELVPKIAELRLAGGDDRGLRLPRDERDRGRAREHGVGARRRQHRHVLRRALEPRDAVDRTCSAPRSRSERWLPPMAELEAIGAFALTEPDHGSDAVALETSARRDGDEYVLDGAKRWIGNASIADVMIVWARDEDGHVGGYLVEKGTPGFDATVMTGKTALRAVWQADIELDDVRVPAENRLPGCRNFRDVAGVLTRTRYTVAWRALGMALGAYEAALAYAKEREQFGKPIASLPARAGQAQPHARPRSRRCSCCACGSRELAGDGRLTAGMASLAKMNHAAKAREIVGRRARHPRRQRHPAREPRRPPSRRHGGDLHLRGHRQHPVADRRPRDHRRAGDRAFAGRGLMADLDLVAASLRADAADLDAFAEALAVRLEGALPGQVEVERKGGLLGANKRVRRIEVTLGDQRYEAEVDRGRVTCRRRSVVRGIALKTQELDLDAWIDALSRDLVEEGERSERGRQALARLLEG